MSRMVALDTETTGFSPDNGDRIVEIGCVEILNGHITDAFFHSHVNPMRRIPASATRIHGITDDMVANKPLFQNIVEDFLGFIADSQLIIHNAVFDMRFLNYQLKMAGSNALSMDRVIDTLLIAKRKFLGSSATLNSLCRRFNIDLRGREYHGALIDARLLARVYIEMEYGNQGVLFSPEIAEEKGACIDVKTTRGEKRQYVTQHPTESELEQHALFSKELHIIN